jgi:hypothetical protein
MLAYPAPIARNLNSSTFRLCLQKSNLAFQPFFTRATTREIGAGVCLAL